MGNQPEQERCITDKMGAHKYLEELAKKKQSDVMRFLLRVRCWELRQLNVIHRASRPSRPDKARRMGYKAKQGYVVYRIQVRQLARAQQLLDQPGQHLQVLRGHLRRPDAQGHPPRRPHQLDRQPGPQAPRVPWSYRYRQEEPWPEQGPQVQQHPQRQEKGVEEAQHPQPVEIQVERCMRRGATLRWWLGWCIGQLKRVCWTPEVRAYAHGQAPFPTAPV